MVSQMSKLATTKMSSKGQVVIPEKIRNYLGLKSGDEFIVAIEDDTVLLKAIVKPEFIAIQQKLKQIRRQAKEAGIKRSDVPKIISEIRGSSE